MDVEDDGAPGEGPGGPLECRPPTEDDLVALCRRLNELGARYVVVGGFAIIRAGYARTTTDVDLIIDTEPENEAAVFTALESLPDKAVRELDPGDVSRFTVVRVADEFIVDLMGAACGLDYWEISSDAVIREVKGVPIPFASPRALWRMKKPTHREKDIPDLHFLRRYFTEAGELPPAID